MGRLPATYYARHFDGGDRQRPFRQAASSADADMRLRISEVSAAMMKR